MMARVPSGCVPIATEIGSVNVTLGISTSLKLWTNSAAGKMSRGQGYVGLNLHEPSRRPSTSDLFDMDVDESRLHIQSKYIKYYVNVFNITTYNLGPREYLII